MPLYGERANALCRLQETISQQTSDLFLFAWYYESFNTVSLFARSPTDFSRGTTVQSVEDHIIPAPFVVQGNMGIQFTYLDERQMKDQIDVLSTITSVERIDVLLHHNRFELLSWLDAHAFRLFRGFLLAYLRRLGP